MAVPPRSGRGFMQPHPDLPSFAWSKDGVAFLWLVALIFGFVLWVALHINHP
jgi:hypothetical protein